MTLDFQKNTIFTVYLWASGSLSAHYFGPWVPFDDFLVPIGHPLPSTCAIEPLWNVQKPYKNG